MNRSLTRGAIGCMIACGALVGPSLFGSAVAKADVLGIGGGGIDVLGIDVLGGDRAKKSATGASGGMTRLSAVSTAPSARSVVIRSNAPTVRRTVPTVPAASFGPVAGTPATMLGVPMVEAIPAGPNRAAPLPAVIPLAVMPPLQAAPAISPPARQAVLIPSTSAPGPGHPLAPADSPRRPVKVPDSFRIGYAEYLRSATTTDIFLAALPGMAGIAGFTLVGAFAGFRQARAVQRALLAPAPTSLLL